MYSRSHSIVSCFEWWFTYGTASTVSSVKQAQFGAVRLTTWGTVQQCQVLDIVFRSHSSVRGTALLERYLVYIFCHYSTAAYSRLCSGIAVWYNSISCAGDARNLRLPSTDRSIVCTAIDTHRTCQTLISSSTNRRRCRKTCQAGQIVRCQGCRVGCSTLIKPTCSSLASVSQGMSRHVKATLLPVKR